MASRISRWRKRNASSPGTFAGCGGPVPCARARRTGARAGWRSASPTRQHHAEVRWNTSPSTAPRSSRSRSSGGQPLDSCGEQRLDRWRHVEVTLLRASATISCRKSGFPSLAGSAAPAPPRPDDRQAARPVPRYLPRSAGRGSRTHRVAPGGWPQSGCSSTNSDEPRRGRAIGAPRRSGRVRRGARAASARPMEVVDVEHHGRRRPAIPAADGSPEQLLGSGDAAGTCARAPGGRPSRSAPAPPPSART